MQTAGGASLNVSDESRQTSSAAPVSDGGRRRRLRLVLVLVAVVVYVLDQLSKLAAETNLTGQPVELLGGLLRLTLVYNPGAAFGLATGYTVILTLLASGVVIFALVLSRKLASKPWVVAFGLLLGGALGNLTDRIFREPGPLRGHVVDFLQIPYWPVFNVADMAVTGAAVLIVLLSLTGRNLDGTLERHRPAKGVGAGDGPVAADAEQHSVRDEDRAPDTPDGTDER